MINYLYRNTKNECGKIVLYHYDIYNYLSRLINTCLNLV